MVEVKKSKAAVRMERKRERERAAGIIETTVKVPAPKIDEIRTIAKEMVGTRDGTAGLIGVYVVVPEPCADAIKRIAKQMREEADTANLNHEETP